MASNKNSTDLLLSRLLVKSYRILKTINASYLESLAYHHVKIGHIMLMMNLSKEGSTSIELSKRAQISKQAMSKLVNELAKKGFLELVRHPEDQRAILVRSTEIGNKFLEDLNLCRVHVENEFADKIGKEKLTNLKEILFLLVGHYENQPIMNLMNESIAKIRI